MPRFNKQNDGTFSYSYNKVNGWIAEEYVCPDRIEVYIEDGRPKKYTPQQLQLGLSLLEQGKTYTQITAMTGISKSTLIRARREA